MVIFAGRNFQKGNIVKNAKITTMQKFLGLHYYNIGFHLYGFLSVHLFVYRVWQISISKLQIYHFYPLATVLEGIQ